MKRFFAAIISVMLCLSLATPAFASSTPSETEPLSYANYPTDIQKESIITSLQHIENLKQSMGLDNVSFSEISVGERLPNCGKYSIQREKALQFSRTR